MADQRSVTVRLGMDTSQYEGAASRAANATRNIGQGGNAAFAAVESAAKAAGAAAMQAFTGVGEVIMGVGAAALATGVNYNALQQSSRAALTTLLGGAEQANAQMDKLDAFAKGSPFAKQVWITAQQQLLGFGMSAEKVIPTLTSINDTVAAVGGSGQTVKEVAYVMAQIQAAGKITAVDLMQLGQRGVNAAELIGSQMGKTGAQIRTDITNGALSAQDALDALVAGMAEKFGGAAANVKKTWNGAVDRVKAAWRDISSIIAEPFVAKTGGGAGVDFANQIADTMRTLQGKIEPIWQGLFSDKAGALGDLPAILGRIQAAIDRLDTSDVEALVAHLKEIGPAVVAVGAALSAGLVQSIPILNRLPIAINPVVAGLGALVLQSPQAREALARLAPAAMTLVDAFMRLVSAVAGPVGAVFASLVDAVTPIVSLMATAAQAVSSLPGPVLLLVAAFAALVAFRGPMTAFWSGMMVPFQAAKTAISGFSDEMRVQQALAAMHGQSLSNVGAAMSTVGATASRGVSALKNFGSSLMSAMGGPGGLALTGALIGIVGGLAVYQAAQKRAQVAADQAAAAQRSLTDALKESNGVITENVRATQLKAIQDAKIGDESAKLTDYGKQIGASLTTQVDAMVGVTGAADQMEAAYQRTRAAMVSQINAAANDRGANAERRAGMMDVVTALDEQHAAYVNLIPNIGEAQSQWRAEVDAVNGVNAATKGATGATAEAVAAFQAQAIASGMSAAAIREQGAAAGLSATQVDAVVAAAQAAGGAATDMGKALKEAAAAADEAKNQLAFFSMELDKLAGKNIDSQRAQLAVNDALRGAKEAFDAASQATDGNVASLLNADGTINTVSESGSKLFGVVMNMRSAYDTATMSAYQQAVAQGNVAGAADAARAAATESRSRFVELAAQYLGGNVPAAQALADSLGIVDGTRIDNKVFTVVGQGIDQALTGLQKLQAMVLNDKQFTVTQINAIQNRIETIQSTVPGGLTANAGGGPIIGPGTGVSDSILMRASAGEWVITEARMKQYGALVRAIHYGTISPDAARSLTPGYAAGGPVRAVDVAPRPVFVGGNGGTTHVVVELAPFDIRFTGEGAMTGHMAAVATEQARAEIARQVRARMGARA